MKKNKIVVLYIITLAVLVLQTIDIFFIHKDGSLFGGNIVARITGIGVAIIASIIMKFNIRNVCFRSYNWIFEILYGVLYAAVPVAICMGAEYAALTLKGYEHLKLNIWFPNTNNDMSIKGTVLAMGLFAVTLMIESVFQELFFRGLLITQFKKKYSYQVTIIVQALLFTLMIVPTLAKNIISGELRHEKTSSIIFVIACSILVEFISGAKWGLYYRVNGTLWMSTADHFISDMLLQCLYVTYSAMPAKWAVVEALAVQTLSLLIFLPLYFTRDRINEENAIEAKVQRELAGLHVDNYSPSPIRHYLENTRRKNVPYPERKPISRDGLEEPISLTEFGLTNEQKSNEKTDIQIGSLKTAPSEMSKAFFEEVKDKSLKTRKSDNNPEQKDDTDFTGGADNISKLVSEYFNDDFKKHTF